MRSIWALGLVVFLSACGGGGGDSGPRVPIVDPRPAQSVTGTQPPSFTHAESLPALSGGLHGGRFAHRERCSNLLPTAGSPGRDHLRKEPCSSYEPFTGIGVAWDLSVGSLQGITNSAVGEKHGVKLAQAQEGCEIDGIRFAQSSYGGGMNYNTFDIGYARGTGAGLEGPFCSGQL